MKTEAGRFAGVYSSMGSVMAQAGKNCCPFSLEDGEGDKMEYPLEGAPFIGDGPLRKFLARRGWIRPGPAGLVVAAAACALICWLPLLLISAAQGLALGDAVRVPFLLDFASHIRFLVAVPLLMIAEVPVGKRLGLTAREFVRSGLVRGRDLSAFRSSYGKASRLGNSALAMACLLALALLGLLGGLSAELAHFSTWQIAGTGAVMRRTAAGWWYAAVSLPLYRFFIYLWLWRLAVWTWFLQRVSRIDLALDPIHPDQAGGLGFLALGQEPFGIITFAAASVISAAMARQIVFEGASFFSFKFLIAGFIFLSVLLFTAPLFLFTRKLYHLKETGLFEYGAFASAYTRDFAQKWIKGSTEGSPLGTPDIQSLSDLSNSFQIIRKMRIIPMDLKNFILLLAAAVGPMVPLVLMSFPLETIVGRIIRMVF